MLDFTRFYLHHDLKQAVLALGCSLPQRWLPASFNFYWWKWNPKGWQKFLPGFFGACEAKEELPILRRQGLHKGMQHSKYPVHLTALRVHTKLMGLLDASSSAFLATVLEVWRDLGSATADSGHNSKGW